MSFTIEFTGKLTENTNHPEITVAHNLTYSTSVRQPASGQYQNGSYLVARHIDGDSNYYGYSFKWAGAVIACNAYDQPPGSVSSGGWTYYKGSLWATYQSYNSPCSSDDNADFYGIYRIGSTSGSVVVTTSTDQEGAPIVGGSAVSETISTTQDGIAGAIGAATEYGLIVKNGATELFRVSHLPPAGVGESSYATIGKDNNFIATSTDLAIESFGLGDGQFLVHNNTNVIIE